MSRNRRNEAGYVAIVVSIIVPVVFIGLAAVSVDVARWYVEIERVQKAADAAALAGVTHMPHDLPAAEAAALAVSARNGYPNSGRTSVDVAAGTKPSELRVTVSSTIDNAFGAAIGLPTQTVSRSALTDYTGPAPMGSPCNTFGNEPPSNSSIMTSKPAGSALLLPPPLGAGFANCSSNPQFWTSLEAPTTNKAWGDRYTTRRCVNDGYQAAAEFCSGGLNTEYREDGYYFVVRVLPAAVGVPIQLQLYDPAYVQTGRFCENMPPTTAGNLTPGSNPYFPVGDTTDRFKKGTGSGPPTPSTYCTGDFDPDALVGHSPSTGEATRFDTTFVLREQTDTLNPSLAPVVSGCVKQYRGHMSASNVADERTFKDTETSRYNRDLARVFHQWVDMCTFTAPREGDHYLQVRSNVQYGGTREAATARPCW